MSALTVNEQSFAHHVRGAVTELTDAADALKHAATALDAAMADIRTDADELRQAAYNARATGLQIVTIAMAVARSGGALEAYGKVHAGAEGEQEQ
ncbi:MAG TPA: hypothetical protein VGJ84_19115 [Polyangiaceae bacterium]|jgi:phage shock protein A